MPVAVTCRVLGLACRPDYRWLEQPVTDAEFEEAYRANALFDAHQDVASPDAAVSRMLRHPAHLAPKGARIGLLSVVVQIVG